VRCGDLRGSKGVIHYIEKCLLGIDGRSAVAALWTAIMCWVEPKPRSLSHVLENCMKNCLVDLG